MPDTVRIAVTPGEPAGIGPDLCVLLAQRPSDTEWVAVADPALLTERATALGVPLAVEIFDPGRTPAPHRPGTIRVVPVGVRTPVTCGRPDGRNAAYVLDTLRAAACGCRDGTFAALVTGPVHKGVINDAGHAFSGHTEFLAELTATPQPVMMLVAGELRVALVTTHLPLSRVPAAITVARLTAVVRVLHHGLRAWWGIGHPRILVCGLNPHAGEQGHLGREEHDVIEPVLTALRGEGLRLQGPLPADTLFIPKHLDEADAVLAMYHDQGLPVVKYAGFGTAVNITLGLPFLRTSVDHGTACELAGTGAARGTSLETALRTAAELLAGRGRVP